MPCHYGFRGIKIKLATGRRGRSILVLCPLSFLPVYLLQQQRTGTSSAAQVRWINSTSIFSSPTDLSPPSHWCRMNDECLNINATTTIFRRPILFSFVSPDVPTQQTQVWHTEQTGVRLHCVLICLIVKSGGDLPLLWPYVGDDFTRGR